MLTRKPMTSALKCAALLAGVAALWMTMAQPSMAASPSAKAPVKMSNQTGASNATDFSSQRRHYARRGGGYGGAAAAAAVAGIVGTAIIASQNRGYYGNPYDSYAYSPGYGGQGYYGGGPRYYGGGGYDNSELGGQGRNGQLYPNW